MNMTSNNPVLEHPDLKNNNLKSNLKLSWADALITQALTEDIGTLLGEDDCECGNCHV